MTTTQIKETTKWLEKSIEEADGLKKHFLKVCETHDVGFAMEGWGESMFRAEVEARMAKSILGDMELCKTPKDKQLVIELAIKEYTKSAIEDGIHPFGSTSQIKNYRQAIEQATLCYFVKRLRVYSGIDPI